MSPTGPVSLIGLDQLTLEQLKAQNRRERLFTARCCGAPVQIRTARHSVPHFFHTAPSPGCDAARRETAEHVAIKLEVALAAQAAGWTVEVEAEERDETGKLVWQADVLATRGRAKVAFEVQLSNPDWSEMRVRQERYKHSDVRGLWLVKTTKPFPVSQGHVLPIFRVSGRADERLVHVGTHLDWPEVWLDRTEALSLCRFIDAALCRHLRWSPLAQSWREHFWDADVHLLISGQCKRCGVIVVRPYKVYAASVTDRGYPGFVWHQGMTGRRSHWLTAIFSAALAAQPAVPKLALSDDRSRACPSCGDPDHPVRSPVRVASPMRARIGLCSLPEPRPGTIEWDWVHRWVLA